MFKPLANAPFFRDAALMAVTLTSRRGGRPKKRLCGNAIHYVFNYSAAPTRASYGFPADKDLLSEEKVLQDATITLLSWGVYVIEDGVRYRLTLEENVAICSVRCLFAAFGSEGWRARSFQTADFQCGAAFLLRLRLSRTEQSFLSRDRILSVSRNPSLNCLGAQRPFPFANLRLTVHAPCNHEKT
jgi:hypothetical protein